jgi:transposase-like protein
LSGPSTWLQSARGQPRNHQSGQTRRRTPGIEVDHVSVYRWVQRFTPLLAGTARPCRHGVGDRWGGDDTYLKVAGVWRYFYRAVDQFGQVVDVWLSPRRDALAAGGCLPPQ